MKQRINAPAETPSFRCAIYARKSTEDGLEQEFNSLDAQREAGEAYIKSQQHEGWLCLSQQYDDGGYTGANMERPALRRLLADIEDGKVDCVVVYKVDRLSRSLLDFARIIETFDRKNVSFVSVTQAFNTATSMGRLVLNVLLSFAQFEREMISERTRDKIAAARRKGKWSGGHPVLGYDVIDTKLVVNELEAPRVREIFALYLERQSLLGVVAELDRRGWTTKSWITKKNQTRRGGRPFGKHRLYELLTNVVYIGQVKYKDETHPGEHAPIVDAEIFRQVQARLRQNGQSGGRTVRNKYAALLRGLLRCGACGCAMAHSYSCKGNKRYRYYVCTQAQQRGWKTCPAPSVPAGEIERFVVEQIRGIGRQPAVMAATFAEIRRQTDEAGNVLRREQAAIARQLRQYSAELHRLAKMAAEPSSQTRVAEVVAYQQSANSRLREIEHELQRMPACVTESEVAQALAEFDQIWAALSPLEQVRVLELLIENVRYDGRQGVLSITFHPAGIQQLAAESAVCPQKGVA